MFGQSCRLTVLAFAVGLHSAVAAAGDNDVAEDAADAIASRILTVTNIVLQNHIDPPTRQQMILTGVRALYRAADRQPPKDLSAQISRLAEPAEIAELFARYPGRVQIDQRHRNNFDHWRS